MTDALDRKFLDSDLAAFAAIGAADAGAFTMKPKGIGEGFAVANRHEQAVFAFANDFAASGGVGCDDGAATGRCFDENLWHAFAQGRKANDVRL